MTEDTQSTAAAGSGCAAEGRPREVVQAVHLLWISVVAGLPLIWMEAQRAENGLGFGALVGAALTIAVVAVLNAQLLLGRNWARLLTLLLFGLSLIGFVLDCDDAARSGLEILLDGATTLIDLWALYLLYTAPGKGWFEDARRP